MKNTKKNMETGNWAGNSVWFSQTLRDVVRNRHGDFSLCQRF